MSRAGIALAHDRIYVARAGGGLQTFASPTITAEGGVLFGAAARRARSLPDSGAVAMRDFTEGDRSMHVLFQQLGLSNALAVLTGCSEHTRAAAEAAGIVVLRTFDADCVTTRVLSCDFAHDCDEQHALVLDWGERGFRAHLVETDGGIVEVLDSVRLSGGSGSGSDSDSGTGFGGRDMDRLVADKLLRRPEDLEAAREAKEAALSGASDPRDPAQLSTPRALHAVMPIARRALEAAERAAGTSKTIQQLVFCGGVFESAALRQVFKDRWPNAAAHEQHPSHRDALGALRMAAYFSAPAARAAPTTAGLRDASAEDLPLVGLDAHVTVADSLAEVVLSQTFRNPSQEQGLEVVYALPVGEDEAVTAMVVEHEDGRRVVARCVDSAAAADEYDDALASGQTAYLARKVSKGMLELSVGNVGGGATVRVSVTVVRPVETAGDALRFCLPVSWLPAALAEQVAFSLRAQFETTAPLQSLTGPPGAVVDVAAGTVSLQQPHVPIALMQLEATTEAVRHTRVLLERHPERGTLAALVTLVPDVPVSATGGRDDEYVFVLDRSGSMGGVRMLEANATLCECLRQLPEGCAFNVVSFGSDYSLLFPASVRCTEQTRADAIAQVTEFQADMGGTNLAEPLQAVFAAPAAARHCRTVFVLTDGDVPNALQVARVVSAERRSRTFTFGIGSGASRELCKRIAHAGGGKAVFCEADLKEAVVLQLERALQPSLVDLRLAAPPQLRVLTQSPATLRPVLHHEAYHVLLGLGPAEESPSGALELSGVLPDGTRWSSAADLDVAARPGTLVHAMLAASAIKDVEEDAALGTDEARARVRELALAAGIASSATSFIAVEERLDAATGEMVSMQVPLRRGQAEEASSAGGAMDCLLLLDVTPLSLLLGGTVVIARNSTVPTRKEVSGVRLAATADGLLEVGVFEGERARPEDNNRLDTLALQLPPDVPAGAVRTVRAVFDIDANGILTVTVTDEDSGSQASVVITNDKGRLGAAEIDEMIRQAQQFAAEDAAFRAASASSPSPAGSPGPACPPSPGASCQRIDEVD